MPSVKSRLIKNISRTKEKILQSVGKSDRTEDENFDVYVENFERQYAQASKLNKELNKYLTCMRETHKASRMFYETLKETYESQWPQSNQFAEHIDLMEAKWTEYLNRLYKDVQLPLVSYLNEFPELKKKIEKRCNRLLDYDNARHSLESAQNKSIKKGVSAFAASPTLTMPPNQGQSMMGNNSSSSSSSSSNSAAAHPTSTATTNTASATAAATTDQLTKLTKLKIDLEDKQHMYEEMNQTLCMALPVLFDNRVKFYSSLFQTLFHTETEFHSDSLEAKSRLDEICEGLSLLKTELIENPNSAKSTTNGRSAGINGGENNSNHHHYHHHHHHNNSHINRESSYHGTTRDSPPQKDDDNDHSYSSNGNNRNSHRHSSSASATANNGTTLTEFMPKTALNDRYSSNEDVHGNDENGGQEIQVELSQQSQEQQSNGELSNGVVSAETTMIEKSNGGSGGRLSAGTVTQTQTTTTTTTIVKDKMMYRVRATYPYEAKELDELTFTKEDLIMVVEGTESEKEDLDEGWLIGVHEITNKRGLFPENFTKRI